MKDPAIEVLQGRVGDQDAARAAQLKLKAEQVKLGEQVHVVQREAPDLWKALNEGFSATLVDRPPMEPGVQTSAAEMALYRTGQESVVRWMVRLARIADELGGQANG